MLYELRVYEPVEGRADALRDRFVNEVVPRFAKHGVELLGVFTSPDAPGRLTYLTRYPDDAARKAAWASFGADPEWKVVKTTSEANGPLMGGQTIAPLQPLLPSLLLS